MRGEWSYPELANSRATGHQVLLDDADQSLDSEGQEDSKDDDPVALACPGLGDACVAEAADGRVLAEVGHGLGNHFENAHLAFLAVAMESEAGADVMILKYFCRKIGLFLLFRQAIIIITLFLRKPPIFWPEIGKNRKFRTSVHNLCTSSM
jgi:hypothetical protein